MLALLALTLIVVDHRNPSVTSPVRTAFSIIGYPLQLIVDAPFRAYNTTRRFFADQSLLSRENAELKEQLRIYTVKYRDMKILEQQNNRLRKLLKVEKRPGYTFSMASILSTSDDRGQSVVTLDKGSRDGVFVKQVVVAEGGSIFGQVINVTPVNSQVMLITDIQHDIPVRNSRTGMQALASGMGKPDLMELESILATSNVEGGDVFISSGLDGLFPADFPVAMVLPNGVKYVPGDPFANIKARPLINFDDTREVLLLWRNVIPESIEDPVDEADNDNQQGDAASVGNNVSIKNAAKPKPAGAT